MNTQILKYNDQEVEFEFNKQNVMVNATEMAKIFGKQVNHFMDTDGTRKFIDACLKFNSRKNGNSEYKNSPFFGIEKEDDLIISNQKSGTWMHRILALKFAAWLNPAFELWVYATIENLLFGRHVKREQSFEKTLDLQKELDLLTFKPDKTGEDFERYLQVQKDLKYETAVRKSLTSESISDMKSLFD
jgi:hypothetical protein